MSRGTSKRQNRLLAIITVAKRPVELTSEVREWMGEPNTKSQKSSLIRAARSLEQRGLIRIYAIPHGGGGRARLIAMANEGAAGECTAAELQRARDLYG